MASSSSAVRSGRPMLAAKLGRWRETDGCRCWALPSRGVRSVCEEDMFKRSIRVRTRWRCWSQRKVFALDCGGRIRFATKTRQQKELPDRQGSELRSCEAKVLMQSCCVPRCDNTYHVTRRPQDKLCFGHKLLRSIEPTRELLLCKPLPS